MTQPSVSQFHGSVDAVLSQNFVQHGKNLFPTDPTTLYQTGNQLDVTNDFCVKIVVAFVITARILFGSTAIGVQMLFLFLALFGPVIFGASFV